jgi:TRAP-type C4-dicarboxylate transport system permease small subunit
MNHLQSSGIFNWILNKMKACGAACLALMVIVTCVDVVGRYFGKPIFGSVEIVGILATLTVVMALPYTHQTRGHIGVELVFRLLPKKVQRVIECSTSVLSIFFFGIVTWRMLIYARTMQRSGEVSMNLELPEHLVIYITAFCFFIFTVLIAMDLAKLLKKGLEGL